MKVKLRDNRCYWCGKPSTSREHVPPKCLFPEDKDVENAFSESFRKDLITVPSCDEHNIKKSNNDEYLMACLSGRVGNNGLAFVHNSTKVNRALIRNPHLLKVDEEAVINVNGIKFPVQWVTVDTIRLINSFEAIARAIYYYEFGESFSGTCKVVSKIFFSLENRNSTIFNHRATNLIEAEYPYWKTDIKGSNTKIFTYQFSPIDGIGTRTLLLNFYEETKIYVILLTINDTDLEQYKLQFAHIVDKLFGDLE